jgi:DNA-directed RNA polymerase subunit E'
MFYKVKVKDHIRFPPERFSEDVLEGVLQEIRRSYEGFTSKELGLVMDVTEVLNIGEGIIIPGDGASYYETEFELISFKPELHEVVIGRIKDIADFGAFLNFGPADGMIHISQTMNDFVSFSKEKVLTGKDSNRILKVGDVCKAKMIAISFKDNSPKIGLTMRQVGLGRQEWIDEDLAPKKADNKPANKKEVKK